MVGGVTEPGLIPPAPEWPDPKGEEARMPGRCSSVAERQSSNLGTGFNFRHRLQTTDRPNSRCSSVAEQRSCKA